MFVVFILTILLSLTKWYSYLYLLKTQAEMTLEDVAKEMTVVCGFQITKDMVAHGIEAITHKKEEQE